MPDETQLIVDEVTEWIAEQMSAEGLSTWMDTACEAIELLDKLLLVVKDQQRINAAPVPTFDPNANYKRVPGGWDKREEVTE